MHFEWDKGKNKKNLEKHGISFEEASVVFSGPVLTTIDGRKNYGEIRKVSIGSIENVITIIVVHTDRSGVVRIISARKANKRETEVYYEFIKKKN